MSKVFKMVTEHEQAILTKKDKTVDKVNYRQVKFRARSKTRLLLEKLAQLATECPDALRDEDILNLVSAKLKVKDGDIQDNELTRTIRPSRLDKSRKKSQYVQIDGLLRGEKGKPLNKTACALKVGFAHGLLQSAFESLEHIVPDIKSLAGYSQYDGFPMIDKYTVCHLVQKGKKVSPILYHLVDANDAGNEKLIKSWIESGVIKSSTETEKQNAANLNCIVVPLGNADLGKVTVIILEHVN